MANDLSGQRFGKILVLNRNFEEQKRRNRKDAFWNCLCDCGNKSIKMGWEIKNLRTQSCGKCYQREEIGNKYGLLTIIKFLGGDGSEYRNRTYFLCQCECGNIIKVDYSHLTSGHTQSCGCSKISQGEQLISSLLKEYNIPYEKEFIFSDLKDKNYLRFDFAILNDQQKPICLIEFDGPQHIKGNSFGLDENFDQDLLIKHDNMKNQYAKEHNIPLIRIPYKDKTKDKIEQYLKKYLQKEGK